MITDLTKAGYNYFGERGLPEHYPVPDMGDDGLFYIQTNQNENTVIYAINRREAQLINEEEPLHVYWVRYTEGGKRVELNTIQKQLAYGYRSKKICNHTYEISVVSYGDRKIFIDAKSKFGAVALITVNGRMAYLTNIYVYAQQMGLFPDVKYLELYGFDIKTERPVYEKIEL